MNCLSCLPGAEFLGGRGFLWVAGGMSVCAERLSEVLPSFFLESAMRAAMLRGLEPILSAIFDEGD